jgi:hypothetical protein
VRSSATSAPTTPARRPRSNAFGVCADRTTATATWSRITTSPPRRCGHRRHRPRSSCQAVDAKRPGPQRSKPPTTATASGSLSADTSVRTFSCENSKGTFVGFRVGEEFTGIGSTTGVGRTPDVTGGITSDGTTLTAATIEADMTAVGHHQRRLARRSSPRRARQVHTSDRDVRAHRADRIAGAVTSGETGLTTIARHVPSPTDHALRARSARYWHAIVRPSTIAEPHMTAPYRACP